MEFSLRLRRRGIHAYCVLDSVIYHKVGSSLKTSARKSEIFTLKRLINLRLNVNRVEAGAASVYYVSNLVRILVTVHGFTLRGAARVGARTWRRSKHLDAVGKELAVDYVRAGDHSTSG